MSRWISISLLVSVCLGLLVPMAQAADEPREGKYRIMTYGAASSPPIFLGSFVLAAGGAYKAFLPGDKPAGEGRYTYDAATHKVSWTSGPYAGVWGGEFTVERDGKTHKIRLKSNTIATNSTDSP
jgi:hypothetical protein